MPDITLLESYFKTENEYYNNFTFRLLCEVLKEEVFESLLVPLELFETGMKIFIEHATSPLQALTLFKENIENHKITHEQSYYAYEKLYEYLKDSEFDEDLSKIKELLKIHLQQLKNKLPTSVTAPLTKDIREVLKEAMHKEINALTENLSTLTPQLRLQMLCKLMPFVLPKIDTIDCERHEPRNFSW